MQCRWEVAPMPLRSSIDAGFASEKRLIRSFSLAWLALSRSSPLDSWPFDTGDSVHSQAVYNVCSAVYMWLVVPSEYIYTALHFWHCLVTQQNFAKIWIQHSQALECAPVTWWDLAFLYSLYSEEHMSRNPTSKLGFLADYLPLWARGSDRMLSWIHTLQNRRRTSLVCVPHQSKLLYHIECARECAQLS